MTVKPQKLVSVIVCNYNYDRYIAEAIKSILDQTYKSIQVIVVDDGCTDSSRQILKSFCDPRLHIIHQENSGQASAFNTAFRECKGELIAFLDSDDFWYPRKLEAMIPVFDDEKVCVVQHNLHIVNEVSELTGDLTPGIAPGRNTIQSTYFKKNHTGFFSPTSGLVCRKTDLDKLFPLDVSWKICADVAFTRPLLIFGDIVTLEEILGGYRIHGENNWMNTSRSKIWVENQQNFVNYTNDWLARYGYHKKILFEKSHGYLLYRAECGLPISYWMKLYLSFRKFAKNIPGVKSLSRYFRRKKFVN